MVPTTQNYYFSIFVAFSKKHARKAYNVIITLLHKNCEIPSASGSQRMCQKVTFCSLSSSVSVVLLFHRWKQNGCCKHILLLGFHSMSNWHIAPLLGWSWLTSFEGNLAKHVSITYWALARGISSQNLLFQEPKQNVNPRVTNCQSQQFFYMSPFFQEKASTSTKIGVLMKNKIKGKNKHRQANSRNWEKSRIWENWEMRELRKSRNWENWLCTLRNFYIKTELRNW